MVHGTKTTAPHQIILMRHGIAEDPDGLGKSDRQRALTEEGLKKTAEVATTLVSAWTPTVAISSDFLRARETAQIVAAEVLRQTKQSIACHEAIELRPSGSWSELARFLRGLELEGVPNGTLLLTGHEPSITEFLCGLLGLTRPILSFKKAAYAVIEMHNATQGELLAFVPPKVIVRSK